MEIIYERPPLPYPVALRVVARCTASTARLLRRHRLRLPARWVGTRLRFADGTSAPVYRETVIADHIADGLRADYEVTVVPVGKATPELVAAADLIVIGGPTHLRGLSSARSRRMAAQAAAKADSALRMDPDAGGPGMRDWLEDLGHRDGLAAVFDTRVNGFAMLTGRASRPIARLLKRHGYRLVASPEGFLVCSHGTLLDGEASWARRWGMTIAAASKTYLPAHV